MSKRWLQVLMVLGYIPGVALAVCAATYVATGGDPLPGDDGARWGALMGLATVGGFIATLALAEETSR